MNTNNWTLKEYFDTVRERIRHEDTLMNARMNALFATQTFLFAGLGLMIKYQLIGLTPLVVGIGVVSSLVHGTEIFAGHKAIRTIMSEWSTQLEAAGNPATPAPIGHFGFLISQPSFIAPWVFFICWLWILACFFNMPFPFWFPVINLNELARAAAAHTHD